MSLQIEEKHLRILKNVLGRYPYQFFAYGSRAKGTARKFSDLDLCYQEEIPLNTLAHLEADFEESDLPFFVELVNWKHMRPAFQELIKARSNFDFIRIKTKTEKEKFIRESILLNKNHLKYY
jgi:uncharacterized protein